MDLKSYADVLKFAIQMQIKCIEEDMQKPYYQKKFFSDTEYLEGMKSGLEIALQKIDSSSFLWNK